MISNLKKRLEIYKKALTLLTILIIKQLKLSFLSVYYDQENDLFLLIFLVASSRKLILKYLSFKRLIHQKSRKRK